MKPFFFLFVVFFFSGIFASNLVAQNMYVRENNNTQTAYPIVGIEKITFSTGDVNIHQTAGNMVNYEMDSVRYIAFQVYTVGVSDFTEENERILLYPNPVETQFNLRLETETPQNCVIEIYTLEGKLVYSEKSELSKNIHTINVARFAQGTYLCKISNGKKSTTTKFVKL